MTVYEGTILSVNEEDEVFRYLVEDCGTILYVGNTLPEYYSGVPITALGSRALVPAFVDSHQHFASFATFHAGLNVMDAGSNDDIMEMASDYIKRTDAKTILAFGASPYSVREHCLISREQLDRVCPGRPMMVVKYDGHACIINTVLLERLRPKLEKLRGFHPDTGEMNQEAFFTVSDYITNSVSVPQLMKNMQKAVDYEVSKGIGMVHTVSGVGFPMNLDIDLEKWFGRSAQNGFQLRVFAQSMNVKTATRRGFPRIGGCFACALDGCFGSADAALNEPYEGKKEDRGVLYYSDEQVTAFCKEANRAGLQIEMHAIGDRAFDQAARALKAALDDCPRTDHRHGIIHDCFPTKEGIQICRDYGIQMPMQTAFIGWKQEPDEYLQTILGSRADELNPMRTLWDDGIMISAGSDAPCTDPDPISWIDHAVNNHSAPQQSLTVHEALRMCTYNGYHATFDEKERGSLKAGKKADMVILSADPYRVPKEELGDITVETTILGGKEYRPQNQSFARCLLSGIHSNSKI